MDSNNSSTLSSVISTNPPLVAYHSIPFLVSIFNSPISKAIIPFLCFFMTPKDPSIPGHLRYLTVSSLKTFIGVTISTEKTPTMQLPFYPYQ